MFMDHFSLVTLPFLKPDDGTDLGTSASALETGMDNPTDNADAGLTDDEVIAKSLEGFNPDLAVDDDQQVDDQDDELNDDEFGTDDNQDNQPDDNNDDQQPDETDNKPWKNDENAKFAEERRKQQEEARIQMEVQRRMQADPAFETAKLLSEQWNMPVEQVLETLKEAALEKQAKEQNVPVEVLRRVQAAEERAAQTEQRLAHSEFKQWTSRIASEGESIRTKYPVLEDADLAAATSYMLNVIRNPNVPFEQAVMAVNGPKIMQYIQSQAQNEALAEKSGRKKAPLGPNGGKSSQAVTLTAEEEAVRKAFGMTREEYLQYK